jgi:hypothetical protein
LSDSSRPHLSARLLISGGGLNNPSVLNYANSNSNKQPVNYNNSMEYQPNNLAMAQSHSINNLGYNSLYYNNNKNNFNDTNNYTNNQKNHNSQSLIMMNASYAPNSMMVSRQIPSKNTSNNINNNSNNNHNNNNNYTNNNDYY